MFLKTMFLIQAIGILIDEWLHHKRGLPLWERVGHSFDTLFVLACFVFICLVDYSARALLIYVTLGVISCLLITKDEWIHKKYCSGFEMWLHAVLFISHPLVFIALGLVWKAGEDLFWVRLQVIIMSLYFVYQVLYWGVFGKSKWLENLQKNS